MEVALPAGMLRDTVDSIDWSYMRAADLPRLADQYSGGAPGPQRLRPSGDGLKEFPNAERRSRAERVVKQTP